MLDISILRTYFSAMSEDGRGETAADGYGITLYDSKKVHILEGRL